MITTSLPESKASTATIVRHYRALQRVEYWFFQKFLPALEAFPDLSSQLATAPAV